MKKYVTISGDTWDLVAYKCYGDEFMCDQLMGANMNVLDYMVFPTGIELNIPDKEALSDKQEALSDYPAWRSVLNGR